jgi:hypothetical protein
MHMTNPLAASSLSSTKKKALLPFYKRQMMQIENLDDE